MRAAINRHLQDNGRNIDIIRGPAFKTANNTLDGLLKEQTRAGLSRPTLHKDIIEEDLSKIADYMTVFCCSESHHIMSKCLVELSDSLCEPWPRIPPSTETGLVRFQI